jgi:hypothetical protein
VSEDVDREFRSGAPGTTPALSEVWRAWEAITSAADPWLDAVTNETLLDGVTRKTPDGGEKLYTYGSLLLRTTYHYWFHTGENAAIRQSLGHTGLPDFVGDIDEEAPYRPEPR